MPSDIEAATLAAIAKISGRDAGALSAETRLREDLGLDSLDAVELLVMAEDDFGVIVSDDQLRSVATVGDLISLLVSLAADGENMRRSSARR